VIKGRLNKSKPFINLLLIFILDVFQATPEPAPEPKPEPERATAHSSQLTAHSSRARTPEKKGKKSEKKI
tara:strand:- start:737 stop:946 length:210 start_codon:yes stop_codon:yes gene_type:complete